MKLAKEMKEQTGVPKTLNSELWYACAGPLVSLPQVGSLAYYFPQGHIQQVADSTRTSHIIPNYPNLPSQLLCQLQNVTLHADTETDDIYAQMSLQPLDSEKEVFPSISQFGLKPSPNNSKHPSEFFCKTLTASDTSTHGGFSVPRRAAEQLFPPLDYTVQPPTQDLVVRDLHDNTWTFRHIFRGQPKRHLLTTGWSLFVGSKRLKAGDSVLFIRDEKSQLLVGIRRANSHQTSLSSSVLSADSMHIGVLAAAAHAAANRSPFTVFYNPRACPSEFVIPLVKYRKAVYETHLSIGFRFGMMFETEDSCKRRYMGSIVGISDLDPLRWPGSKWRNIQVEWDEPGCSDKQNRVSSWDIETPESFFLFQSLTSSLKRPLQSGLLENEWSTFFSRRPSIQVPENGTMELSNTKPNLYSEQMIKFPFKHQLVNNTGNSLWIRPQESSAKRGPLEELNAILPTAYQKQKVQLASSVSIPQKNLHFQAEPDRCYALNLHSPLKNDQHEKLYPPAKMDNPLSSVTVTDKSKLECEVLSDLVFDFASIEGCNIQKVAANPVSSQCLADQLTFFNQNHNPLAVDIPQPDSAFMNSPLPQLDIDQWMYSLSCLSSSNSLRDLSAEINSQIEFDNSVNVGGSNKAGATVADPSTSSAILDEFCTLKEKNFQNSSDCLMSRDVQSQITSASLAESHVFSMQDKSGGASSSHVDFDECSFVQNNSRQQVAVQPAPRRTYTKVQKAGSVGRSIDVATLKNYEELILAIECMFGLEGLLKDTRGSGWKLVYVDYENDVLLVGDDPWELFVGCVRCIRILSPTEVQQMSEEGMKLLNSGALQGINGSMSGGST